MRTIKDRRQAEVLLESAKKSLAEETELFEKCENAEVKKLYLENINKIKKVIADIKHDLQRK